MRDPNRIKKILNTIEKIWEKCPDLRLGQLLTNAVHERIIYFIEDEDLEGALKEYYEVKD